MNALFVDIITTQLLALFPGADVLFPPQPGIPAKGRNNASLGNGNLSLIIREDIATTNDYLIVKRQQFFSLIESNVADWFIKELIFIDYLTIKDEYKSSIFERCIEIAIIKSLTSNSKPIESVIDLCKYWTTRTYEGSSTSFSIKVPFHIKDFPNRLSHFKEDYFASITNGYEDCIVLGSQGQILQHRFLDDYDANSDAPFRFLKIAKFSGTGIIVVLTRTGDILIFSQENLLWAKKNGRWVYYDHATCKKLIAGGSRKTQEYIRHSMYLTALDVSFTKTGGILACVDAGKVAKMISDDILDENDLVETSLTNKASAVRSLILGKDFPMLHRSLRAELTSMDGAFIFDTNGKIVAIGAIIKIPGGSNSGGRLAATKELSKYGTAIKISNDAYIDCYRNSNRLFYIS